MPISTHADPLDAPRSHGVPASELCFLVAEDHEFQRSMLVQMLENLGATGVYEAEDGRAAMEITRELEHPFDIIVTDIDMPGMDGLALCKLVKEDRILQKLPVAIFSSMINEPLAKKCAVVGADVQYTKPDLKVLSVKLYDLVTQAWG